MSNDERQRNVLNTVRQGTLNAERQGNAGVKYLETSHVLNTERQGTS